MKNLMKEFKLRVFHNPTKTIQFVSAINFNNKYINTYGVNEQGYGVSFDDVFLMRYSGMKDKNGAYIYESDILKLDEEFIKITGSDRRFVKVGFERGSFMYGRSFVYDYMDTYLWMAETYCAVVGNIYTNPELLLEEMVNGR